MPHYSPDSSPQSDRQSLSEPMKFFEYKAPYLHDSEFDNLLAELGLQNNELVCSARRIASEIHANQIRRVDGRSYVQGHLYPIASYFASMER